MMSFFSIEDSMANDERLHPDAMAALRARFEQQSRKAQAYYTVMHEVRAIVGTDDAANDWMNRVLPALGGKTPAQLVGEGREAEVREYLKSLKAR
ncbi:MbcA/ParS/Xre antitoxin family protein [Massilia sp. DD77]|uniref:MbcA/ParS/Xre antitoxin family protein n=1 Tax=Massilia sp. DD77 TaxID=3109349 RepID=UPI0030007DC7